MTIREHYRAHQREGRDVIAEGDGGRHPGRILLWVVCVDREYFLCAHEGMTMRPLDPDADVASLPMTQWRGPQARRVSHAASR